jgi:ATP-dependent RNA helicase DeaD
VALAAVSLAEAAAGRDGDGAGEEIAPASLFGDRGSGGNPAGQRRDGRRTDGSGRDGPGSERGRAEGPWVRLWVGAGRESGVRPGDLVGSITNEAGVPARAIGAIQISGRFSIVEVAEGAADDIVRSMRGVQLRGKPVQIRRDREPAAPFVRPRPG